MASDSMQRPHYLRFEKIILTNKCSHWPFSLSPVYTCTYVGGEALSDYSVILVVQGCWNFLNSLVLQITFTSGSILTVWLKKCSNIWYIVIIHISVYVLSCLSPFAWDFHSGLANIPNIQLCHTYTTEGFCVVRFKRTKPCLVMFFSMPLRIIHTSPSRSHFDWISQKHSTGTTFFAHSTIRKW